MRRARFAKKASGQLMAEYLTNLQKILEKAWFRAIYGRSVIEANKTDYEIECRF
ncbi:hypothetical protein [Nitrosomonas ureae]|uniref:hypothetical protein n=1 Tax=Nitrosomonas ureae TaxID=44577 RepID=UPI000AEAC218|nr:hypothetical protein [Nitrosomonas ureae]